MEKIDLRSDTVTLPTQKMRDAMHMAPLGDDVYREDPSVLELEEECAKIFLKEASLFVPSGTFANLCSLLTHCQRGDEIILARESHIFKYEVGGLASYGGILANTLPINNRGEMNLYDIQELIRPHLGHFPTTRLICLENTQGGAFGSPLTLPYVEEVSKMAHLSGAFVHMDGARIFNACVALDVSPEKMVSSLDSFTVCLSKGLCAPVGSMIVGSSSFIERARKIRRSLGGGLRQSGVLASAGLVALREMRHRLSEDHRHAYLLAQQLSDIPHIEIDFSRVRTNMVPMILSPSSKISVNEFCEKLAKKNILVRPYNQDGNLFRLVTHYWIKEEHIGFIVGVVKSVLEGHF